MTALGDRTFTAALLTTSTEVRIYIDHPGFLRGYQATLKLPDLGATTISVNLPVPGSLHVTADLRYPNTRAEYNLKSKFYCISSKIRQVDPYAFDIEDTTPLQDWKLQYDDLAPGKYELFSTGRGCVKYGEYGGGPAGVAGQSNFTIKPETLTEMSYPMFPRGKFSEREKTTPKIIYRTLSSVDETTGVTF